MIKNFVCFTCCICFIFDSWLSMSTTVEPSQLTPADQKRVSELRVLFGSTIQSKIARITLGDRCLDLPEATLRLVAEAVENLAEGRSVTLVTEDEGEDEISPQEAATILGVSRPFASRLFDDGAIPCRRVGTHRRALRRDVVGYRERQRESRKRALDELAAEGQRLNLGY